MSWWESAYRSGHINWDPGEYDGNLPWLLETFNIVPCRVIDIGCGNGKSLVWLAEQGFEAVGVDLAPTAVKQAEALAIRRGVTATFIVGEFPNVSELSGMEFDLIIERGFLQHLSKYEMKNTLRGVSELLSANGVFYSLLIAESGVPGYSWMKRWKEAEIRKTMSPFFEIVGMKKSVFTPGEVGSLPAWVVVMRNIKNSRFDV